jgi:uncharacterized protein
VPTQQRELLSERHRAKELVLVLVKIFEPLPVKQLIRLPHSKPASSKTRDVVSELLASGELILHSVKSVDYVTRPLRKDLGPAPNVVRILAPFDPLVWDRVRFGLFWNWDYRFEAYTPVAKRVRGYYAMPILWKDDVVGWANVTVRNGQLHFDIGYEKKFAKSREYKTELDKELERFREFMMMPG